MNSVIRIHKRQLSRHESLVGDRQNLEKSRDTWQRLLDSLRDMRTAIVEPYNEMTKLRLSWRKYRVMNAMIKETLAAFELVECARRGHERRGILAMYDVADWVSDRTLVNKQAEQPEGATDALQDWVAQLRSEITSLHSAYRYESQVFTNLQREYQALQKRGLLQRYVSMELLLKITALPPGDTTTPPGDTTLKHQH